MEISRLSSRAEIYPQGLVAIVLVHLKICILQIFVKTCLLVKTSMLLSKPQHLTLAEATALQTKPLSLQMPRNYSLTWKKKCTDDHAIALAIAYCCGDGTCFACEASVESLVFHC